MRREHLYVGEEGSPWRPPLDLREPDRRPLQPRRQPMAGQGRDTIVVGRLKVLRGLLGLDRLFEDAADRGKIAGLDGRDL